MRHNSVATDITHGLIHFPHLKRQVKNAVTEATAKPQPVLAHDGTTIPPMTTKTIRALVNHPLEWHTTGNRHRDASAENWGSSESANIPLNVNHI